MNELQRWLPVLTPPAGGEHDLRAALAVAGRQRSRPWEGAVLAFASASCMFLLLNLWLLQLPKSVPDPVAQVMHRVAAKPISEVSVRAGDAVEVASGSAQVRVFLVMSQ